MATEMATSTASLQSFARRVGRELSNEGALPELQQQEREKDRHTRAKRIAGHGQKRYILDSDRGTIRGT